MKKILLSAAANGTYYIPAPCRGVVAGVKAVWQSTVTVANIVTVSRDTSPVNTVTVVTTSGMVVENGVRNVTYKDLVFDPDSTTLTYGVIKVVLSGGNAIAAVVEIDFDEYATVEQVALEA